MTTPLFRAYIGPSANRVHIGYENKGVSSLTLCERTSAARPVSGNVNHAMLCVPCIHAMAKLYADHRGKGDVVPLCDTAEGLAQAIGLEKIL